MADDIVNPVDKTVDRRSFLRGSGLFAAALGLGVASPLAALAQEPQRPKDEKKSDKKKDDKDEKKSGKGEEKHEKKDEKQEEKQDEKKKDDSPADQSDPETLLDKDGREYRTCPQCGANMYKQGRTWTCENCGYSYVE